MIYLMTSEDMHFCRMDLHFPVSLTDVSHVTVVQTSFSTENMCLT